MKWTKAVLTYSNKELDMKRRDFLMRTAGVGVASLIPFTTQAHHTGPRYKIPNVRFSHFFEKQLIDLDSGLLKKLNASKTKTNMSEVFSPGSYKDGKVWHFVTELGHSTHVKYNLPGEGEHKDILWVPMLKSKNVERDCMNVMLSAAVDRNSIIWNELDNKLNISNRLVSLMKVVMRRTYGLDTAERGKLTDLIVPASLYKDHMKDGIRGIKIHSSTEFDGEIDILELALPKGCTKMVLGIDRTRKDLVMPQHNGDYGIASLSPRSLLLGAV